MRYLLILPIILVLLSSCEQESLLTPSEENLEATNFMKKAGSMLHHIATAYELSKLEPEGIVALKSGALLLPTLQGQMEMVGHEHSTISAIGKAAVQGKVASINSLEEVFSSTGSAQRINQTATQGLATAGQFSLGVDGTTKNSGNLIPMPIDLLNLEDFEFDNTGFRFDRSLGASFKMTPDASNLGGLVVVIQFKNDQLRTIRSAFAVADDGNIEILPEWVSLVPSGTTFTIRLLRIKYELLDRSSSQVVFTGIEEVRGDFLAIN